MRTSSSSTAKTASPARRLRRTARKRVALSMGTVSILDTRAVVFTRIWCTYEVYVSLQTGREGYLHDCYTAYEETRPVTGPYGLSASFENEKRAHRGVGITDGFVAADKNNMQSKLGRESYFPRGVLQKALGVKFEEAEASMQEDKQHILNSISRIDLDAEPLRTSPHYTALNNVVRGKFAVSAMRKAFETGGENFIDACLDAVAGFHMKDLALDFRGTCSREYGTVACKVTRARSTDTEFTFKAPTSANTKTYSGGAFTGHVAMKLAMGLPKHLEVLILGLVQTPDPSASAALASPGRVAAIKVGAAEFLDQISLQLKGGAESQVHVSTPEARPSGACMQNLNQQTHELKPGEYITSVTHHAADGAFLGTRISFMTSEGRTIEVSGSSHGALPQEQLGSARKAVFQALEGQEIAGLRFDGAPCCQLVCADILDVADEPSADAAEALVPLAGLRKLCLMGNALGDTGNDSGVRSLTEALNRGALPKLEMLDVQKNGFGGGVSALQTACSARNIQLLL
eukprot:NODE_1487_length_2461_cov_8.077978.p1 GENE.NODE_1487_length_2461_cov_8.077978~~NODE_1487_length_2461_cov_8.077978.p1  ORF type:complete len:517 (+),score=162.17 NODE_1487_length_2461_cov_8.077978:573-2123(+)